MKASNKKANSYKAKPSVSDFNNQTNDAQVLKFFNDSVENRRMEFTDLLNQSGKYPTVIPDMKGSGSKKSNGGK